MKIKLLIYASIFACTFAARNIYATNLELTRLELVLKDGENKHRDFYVDITISWQNAWYNKKNYDAAWVFFKYLRTTGGYTHAKIRMEGHSFLSEKNPGNLKILPSKDGTGIFLQPTSEYRGPIEARVRIQLDTAVLANKAFVLGNHLLNGYGIEMVYIPDGHFFLGDSDSLSIRASSFYKSGGDGRPDGSLEIRNETEAIPVGKEKGAIYYHVGNKDYQGDQSGPVPASYPKGVNGFYIMKYELQQSQYANFLNSLQAMATSARSKIASKDYHKLRGGISLNENIFVATTKNRPANFVSWDDGCAFADWAALRPMTDFEYVKVCRGPTSPVPRDYPWGTASKDKLKRFVDADNELKWADGLNESQLNDANRETFGASYYWVMDLAGSLWERVVSIGAERGRRFVGSHGDGNLSYGYATNTDWPSGDHNSGGYGFAGGGFYQHGLYTAFHVPHSPVAARNFGSWAGGYASEAYGQRFVRTADR